MCPGGGRSNLFSCADYGLLFPDNASSGHFEADALPLWLSCLFQCLFPDEVLFCQFHRKGKSRFQWTDLLIHFMSVQWHRRLHPKGVSRPQPAWNEAFFLSSFQKGVPHLRRIFGRQIQFHTILTGVPGFGYNARDACHLGVKYRMIVFLRNPFFLCQFC